MSDEIEHTPFQIDPSSLVGQVGALLRYLLTFLGSFALGKGWIKGDDLQAITAFLTVFTPMAYGVWKTYHNKQKLVAVAEAAPDYIAVVTKTDDTSKLVR